MNPQPNAEEILKHYPKKYFPFMSNSPTNINKMLYRTFYSKNGSFLFKIIFSPLKPFMRSYVKKLNGKLLDVGCGSGDFLIFMREHGMQCYGVEPGEFNKKLMKENGIKVLNTTLKKARYEKDYFDIITINHVLEHVSNPEETLKELYRILKPNGTLIIATPQSNCIAYKIFGRDWTQLDVPRHLFIFSTKILEKYATKIGFKFVKTRYNSTPFQFSSSVFYWLNSHSRKKRYLSESRIFYNPLIFVILMPFAYLCNIFGVGDQIEVFLTK